MDPATIQTMYRFNTWANDGVREGLLSADEQALRAPVEGMWFGSLFFILAHIHGAAALWLARLKGDTTLTSPPSADDFASGQGLADAWRAGDEAWEEYVATLTPGRLDEDLTVRRRDGSTATYKVWQAVMQIPFHGTEHRGHATVAMTQLGIKHGPQDFIVQYPPRV